MEHHEYLELALGLFSYFITVDLSVLLIGLFDIEAETMCKDILFNEEPQVQCLVGNHRRFDSNILWVTTIDLTLKYLV
ncbi:21359_t:CDS:2, partial [Gigaspora margarita]